MVYSVRGEAMGYMPSLNNPNGFIAEGNLRNSYGPWIDPELNRRPHRRRTAFNRRGRKHRLSDYYGIGV